MDQEHVLGLLSMFFPDVRLTDVSWLICGILLKPLIDAVPFFLQPKDEQLRKQIIDEYTGTGEDRVKNRDGFTEVLGDVLFLVPAIKAANAHRGRSQMRLND